MVNVVKYDRVANMLKVVRLYWTIAITFNSMEINIILPFTFFKTFSGKWMVRCICDTRVNENNMKTWIWNIVSLSHTLHDNKYMYGICFTSKESPLLAMIYSRLYIHFRYKYILWHRYLCVKWAHLHETNINNKSMK